MRKLLGLMFLTVLCLANDIHAASNVVSVALAVAPAVVAAKPHWQSAYRGYKPSSHHFDCYLQNANSIVIQNVHDNARHMGYPHPEKIIVKRGDSSVAAQYGKVYNSFVSFFHFPTNRPYVIVPDYACSVFENKGLALTIIGLRSKITLSRDDLKTCFDGVIGHEVGHILRRDSLRICVALLVIPLVTGLAGYGVHRKIAPIFSRYAQSILSMPENSMVYVGAGIVIAVALAYVQDKANNLALRAYSRAREQGADRLANNQHGLALRYRIEELMASDEDKAKEQGWFYSHPPDGERAKLADQRAGGRGQKRLADVELKVESLQN